MARRLGGYRFGRSRVREAAAGLLRQAPAVLRLFGRLMADARVSIVDKAFVGAVVAYVISPWDLVPDFLSIIGVVDDLFLIGLALDRLLMRAPIEAVEEHWEGTPEGLSTLTAELKAIGEALPAAIRGILHGRVDDGSWGAQASADVYEGVDEEDLEWEAAQREVRRSRRRRGREVAVRDFDAQAADEEADEDDEYGDDRMERYRNRL